MTIAELEALVARAGTLAKEIRALESLVDPLRAELTIVNRKIAGIKLGRNSVSQRRQAVLERNRQICAEARKLDAARAYVPIFWQQRIAEKYRLSTRQVRRILRDADIKVDR